jgi:hypothetical protein
MAYDSIYWDYVKQFANDGCRCFNELTKKQKKLLCGLLLQEENHFFNLSYITDTKPSNKVADLHVQALLSAFNNKKREEQQWYSALVTQLNRCLFSCYHTQITEDLRFARELLGYHDYEPIDQVEQELDQRVRVRDMQQSIPPALC